MLEVLNHKVEIPMVPAPPAGAKYEERQKYLPGTFNEHYEWRMNAAEAELMHRIYWALVESHATCGEDRHSIRAKTDVMRWLFEQLGASNAEGEVVEAEASTEKRSEGGPRKKGRPRVPSG